MIQLIHVDKSLSTRKDLAYNLILHSNLGVIKADKSRKNLEILKNWSIGREREITAAIMKIFAAEGMARQYKIDGLSFEGDLHFFVHRLVA